MPTPDLISPSKITQQTEEPQNKNYSGTLVYVLSGIIICLLLIVSAMLFLPEAENIDINQSQDKTSELKPGVREEKTAQKNSSQEKAILNEAVNEKIEIDWMVKKTQAENENMAVWAKENYEQALILAKTAAKLKIEKNFRLSEKKFQLAIELIDEDLKNKENIFKQFQTQADSLFKEENLLSAKDYYLKAQSIKKDNSEVNRKLARIDTRDEVLSLYQNSLEKEKNHQLDSAIKLINKAMIIEPEYKKLKKRQVLLKSKKLQQVFNKTISQLLEALENNDLKQAKNSLQTAKKLKPEDSVISEMTLRVTAAVNQHEINRLKKKAGQQEKQELWQQAEDSYKKILAIDAHESQAIVSKRRVAAYIYFNKLLNAIVSKPERLQNDKVLQKSEKSLKYVKAELKHKSELLFNKIKKPKLKQKIATAEQIIKNASKKIKVKISSDNETDVALYKTGKFGKLIEKNIELRPGEYTIVGSRPGYRDFRKKFTVSASDQMIEIRVQCRDKI